MLPPVDERVLRENPKFAALYKTLTTEILNPDGTTRNDPRAKEHAANQERLRELQLDDAKRDILIETISSLTIPTTTSQGQNAPSSSSQTTSDQELQDLILMLPPLLSPTLDLPPETLHTLLTSPPLSNLDTHLPRLVPLIASSLQSQAAALVRVVSPSTNPSFAHRNIDTLVPQVESLRETLASQAIEIANARARALTSAIDLLALYSQAAAHLIRALEGKHGVAARSLELRATELALDAKLAACDARGALARARKEVYDHPGVMEALARYRNHLELETERLDEAIRRAKDRLEEYGVGVPGEEAKEKKAREMGRVYLEMQAEIESVRKDIERLEKQRS